MSRLLGYSRVSTLGQRDNTSLDDQRSRIHAYCRAANHELFAFFEDVETASGNKVRPAFTALLEMLYANQADGIVCTRIDRFARNTTQGLKVATELRKRDKQLVVVDLSLDTTIPSGRCMLTVLLAFSQLERQTIAERCRAGTSAKLAAGEYAFGQPPFGWDSVDGQLVINPFEFEMRRQIFEWYANGMRCTWISDELNQRGVRTKRNRKWFPSTIKNMILRGDKYRFAHLLDGLDSTEVEHAKAR